MKEIMNPINILANIFLFLLCNMYFCDKRQSVKCKDRSVRVVGLKSSSYHLARHTPFLFTCKPRDDAHLRIFVRRFTRVGLWPLHAIDSAQTEAYREISSGRHFSLSSWRRCRKRIDKTNRGDTNVDSILAHTHIHTHRYMYKHKHTCMWVSQKSIRKDVSLNRSLFGRFEDDSSFR